MSHYPHHMDERDERALEEDLGPAVEAEAGEPAEAVEEEWSTLIRFREDPYSRKLDAGEGVPPDTILAHLANAEAIADAAIQLSEPRLADGGDLNDWATLRIEDARRLRARIRAVRDELVDAFERQAMIDTSAHADNLPF